MDLIDRINGFIMSLARYRAVKSSRKRARIIYPDKSKTLKKNNQKSFIS